MSYILSISFESVDIFLAKRHFVCAEKLVEVSDKPFCRIAKVYRVLSFKLTYYLLREYIVKRGKLVAAAADIHGNIRLYLLHNSVTERDVEVLDKIFIKVVKSFLASAAYVVFLERFFMVLNAT